MSRGGFANRSDFSKFLWGANSAKDFARRFPQDISREDSSMIHLSLCDFVRGLHEVVSLGDLEGFVWWVFHRGFCAGFL